MVSITKQQEALLDELLKGGRGVEDIFGEQGFMMVSGLGCGLAMSPNRAGVNLALVTADHGPSI